MDLDAPWTPDELRDLYLLLQSEEFRTRLGLPAEGPLTLDQLGRLLGITKQAIQQTELRALRKMRRVAPSKLDALRVEAR